MPWLPRSCSPTRASDTSSSSAIQNEDYFLLQGVFLFVIIGVLVANFLIDIAYVLVDPRTRIGMQGGAA